MISPSRIGARPSPFINCSQQEARESLQRSPALFLTLLLSSVLLTPVRSPPSLVLAKDPCSALGSLTCITWPFWPLSMCPFSCCRPQEYPPGNSGSFFCTTKLSRPVLAPPVCAVTKFKSTLQYKNAP